MEEYPGNSHKAKDAPKKTAKADKQVQQIVDGGVVRRKKPLGKRFAETFVGGDAKSVWGYVTFDVLIPAAKDAVSDAISQGVEKMLFGEVRGGRSSSRSRSSGSYTSYNRFSQGPTARREDPRPSMSRRARARHDFDEIILATRHEADEVIDQLFNIISQYDSVTVADLYQSVNLTGTFTDEQWGWTDLRGAGVVRVKGGYLLDLPPVEPLD